MLCRITSGPLLLLCLSELLMAYMPTVYQSWHTILVLATWDNDRLRRGEIRDAAYFYLHPPHVDIYQYTLDMAGGKKGKLGIKGKVPLARWME